MLLPIAYNPPIEYLCDIYNSQSDVIFDQHEHLIKQTIRNRCHILGPNGIQTLVVPIEHNSRTNTPVKDITIANQTDWQRQHWMSLNTAYNRSAFYEFYKDDYEAIYTKSYKFLLDLNLELTELMFKNLEVSTGVELTTKFLDNYGDNDLRDKFSSGKPSGSYMPYPQVFTYKYEFTTGLSALDLLFNTGTEATNYLRSQAKN